MSVLINIPTPLRTITKDRTVEVEGKTLEECINNLEEKFNGIKKRLINDDGEINKFINFYINGDDVRHSEGLETKIEPGSSIDIVPAMAGG
tara:strand:- start:46 stop:318 length:273 start_codon:yes stop_codon:yes gene_type:complete